MGECFLIEALGLELETPFLPMSYLFETLSALSHELGRMGICPLSILCYIPLNITLSSSFS